MPQDSSNNPLSVLYKDLINDNWDLPSEQEFVETYSNPENLKLLRSDLINDNWELPEEEEFISTYLVQDLKKKEVLDSPSDSSQEVSPSPSKQVDAKDLIVPQAIQNQLNPQKEFNPEDFKLMVEQNKQQKLDKALEASKPVQAETSDVISQQVPVQSAEEMVAKDESIRDDEKLTANQLVKNKEKYETITKSLEDNIRDIPASELPNLYDAFDDKTKEFLDFQTRGEKDAFIDLLAQKREEVLDNQIKEYQVNELESFKPIDEGMTDELKQELALTKQKEENLSKGLSRIQEYTGLSGDDLVAFKQKVSEYNKLLEISSSVSKAKYEEQKALKADLVKSLEINKQKISEYNKMLKESDNLSKDQIAKLNSLREEINKASEVNKQKVSEYNKLLESSRDGGTLTPEQKSKLNSLREDIKKVTDIQGDFYDPITGKLSPEYTKEVLDTQEAIVGEYKNDYTKMSDRHAYLASKLRMLEKESVDMAVGNSTDPKLRERYLQDPMSPVRQYANYPSYNPEGQKRKAKAQEKLEEYKETMKEFDALNRALLLNEDPSKVERGFLSAMGESLYEGLIGEIVTDNDYRKNIVAQAQEAGIEINEEKAEELQDTFKEQLGETLGSSTAIGAEIAVTSFLTGGVAGALGAAGKSVPYLNRMYKVYQTNKKAAKVMDKAYDIIKSGVDFELASDETSFAMGAAEKSVGDLSEYLVKKLAGGKLGAFTKLFARVGGRIVGGTAEEYGGDLADNLAEFGFTEQAIKETFGEGEEGLQKLYLIMAMSGMFGLPTEAVSFFKDKLAEIKAKRESGGTISESDAELESYIDQVIGEDNTIPDTSDITPEKQEALKEAGINLESEPTLEETEEVTEEVEVEPTVEEELTALAEKYKADPEAVKAELGITEEPTATEEVVVEDSPVVDQEVKTEEEVTTEGVDPEKIEATTEEEVSVSEPIDTKAEEQSVAEDTVYNNIEEVDKVSPEKFKKEREKVKKIKKALGKLNPNVKFVFHENTNSYLNSSENATKDSRAYRDGDVIHIDLSSSVDNTSFHESIHPILEKLAEDSPEYYSALASQVENNPDFKSYVDSAKSEYGTDPNVYLNEALTEYLADVASGKFNNKPGFVQSAVQFIKDLLSKIGLRASDYNIDLNNIADVKDFASTIGSALARGKAISFEVEKQRNNKIKESVKKIKSSIPAAKTKIKSSLDKLDKSINQLKSKTSDNNKQALSELNNKLNELRESLSSTKDKSLNEFFKAVDSISNQLSNIKSSLSDQSISLYEKATGLKDITAEGIISAAAKSKEFLNSLKGSLKESISKVLDFLKKLARNIVIVGEISSMVIGLNTSIKANDVSNIEEVIWVNLESIPDFIINGVIDSETELGDLVESAYQRLSYKFGNPEANGSGSAIVSDEFANSVEKVTKESKEKQTELQSHINENTFFSQSDSVVTLYGKKGDNYKVIGTTRNFENQFPADSGFIYIAAPNQGSNKGVRFKAEGFGVAQFLLDASVSDNQAFQDNNSSTDEGHYSHEYNIKILEVAKENNDYVPIYEKLGNNQVRVKYKRFNDVKSSEKIMSPLRQFKFSDLDWNKKVKADGFGEGVYTLPLKDGKVYPYPGKTGTNQTDIIFSKKKAMGQFDGIGAVFIYTDSKGVTWVTEFNGSVSHIQKKGLEIIKKAGISESDLTIGYHDVGSYSARPAAENGVVDSKIYKNFNKKPETGGALYYPPIAVNYQKKGLSGKATDAAAYQAILEKSGVPTDVAKKMAEQFVENQNKKAQQKQAQEQAKLDKKNLIAQAKETFKKSLEKFERETASEAAFDFVENSDLYKSLTKEEQAELKAQVEKFTSSKPKAEVAQEEKVETTKKQLLLDRIKNLKEGGDTLLKNVKDTKKELAKIIKGLQPDLTKEQYRQLVKVLQSTNTSEDLNSAILKIDNIAKYGKANPTTADIIQGEVKATEEFTEEQISELVYSEIERNNKQVKREDLKTIKELVKSLNLTSSALGKVSGAQVISLIKAMKKMDLSNTEDLAELRGILEKQRSNNFQAKLKAAFKNSRTGNKGSLAERLINVDPNLINDYDTYNAVASALINSNRNKEYVIEGKTYSGAEIATKIEELEKQAEQNKADLEVAKAEVREKLLKEQYKKSSFSQGNPPLLTFDEYASLVDSQNTKAKEQASLDILNKRLNALAERRDELKGLLKDSKQRLKDYISNDPNMSPETKRMLNSLVKFLSSDSNIENLVGDKGEVNKLTKDMLQAIEEVLAFNSTAAITSAAAVSNAINKSNELPKLGKIFRDKLIGIRLANKMASLDTAITFASKTVDQANEFIAQVLGDFKASSARARFKSVEFNKEIERLVSRARMSPEKSQLMGMVSFLTQENAKWYSFEEKKAIIEGQIKVLGENNENNKYVKSLEETYEQLKDFNSLEELNDALDKTEILQEELDVTLEKIKELKDKYNNTSDKKLKDKYTKEIDNNLKKAKDIKKSLKEDTLFNQKEKDVLNYVRDRFKEIEPKLRESNYNNKGIDTESYTNYTPLYTHTLGDRGKLDTEEVLEDNMFTNKLDTKESSRTISRRKSTPGNVAYNFDFVESAKAGMYDAVYDIETLFDRKTLANLMKTQGYKDLFKTKQGDQFAGYALNLINERIKQYANAKTPSKPSDRMKSDISPAIRISQSILRNIMAYPLKNVGQIFKQTVPIATQVGTMLMNHPVKFLTSFKEVMTEDFLNSELYKSSASGTRLAGGEVAFDKTGSPVAWLLRKLYNPEGEGNKVSKAYEKNLSEVLTTSDNFINRVSLLAFYKAEAEKAGIPVDYNNPDPKVLAKAQAEASRINNVSDPAEMGELFAAQGKDAKDLKFLSQAFFMYKSFAVNAALNASINIRNLTTKPKATDLKRLAGALAGVIAFNMIGQAIRDQVKKVASDTIDRELPEDEDKTIPEYAIEQMSRGIFDLFTGTLPNFSEGASKEAFNYLYSEGYEMATDEQLEKKPYYTEEGYNIMQLMLVTDYIDNTASIVQAISDSDSGLSDKEKAVLIAKFLGNVGFEGNIKMFTEGVSRDILKEYEKLKK